MLRARKNTGQDPPFLTRDVLKTTLGDTSRQFVKRTPLQTTLLRLNSSRHTVPQSQTASANLLP